MADEVDGSKSKRQLPVLVDNPAVAEVYADNIVSLAFSHGNAILTMGTARTSHTKELAESHCVVSSRLVIPVPVAIEMHEVLGRLLRELHKKGVVRKASGPAEKIEQQPAAN
jgi:hypothetical protein